MNENILIFAGIVILLTIFTLYRIRQNNNITISNIEECKIISKINLGGGQIFAIIEYKDIQFAITYKKWGNNGNSTLVKL